MYYMKVLGEDEEGEFTENKLVYFCKYCGFVDEEEIETNNLRVFKFTKNNKSKDININQYTKYDPTLPHMHTIKCPNSSCDSNDESKDIKQDVIYLRYDDKNMKYMYLCCHCDYNWV